MGGLAFERPIRRSAGILLIAGAVIMFAGASLPFLTSLGADAWLGTPGKVLDAVADNQTAWTWANTLIAVAAITTTIGLTLSTNRFPNGRHVALAGSITFAIAATLETVSRILNSTLTPWAADNPASQLAESFEAVYRFSEALISTFILIAFASLALFGTAALQDHNRQLGLTLILASATGFTLELAEAAIPALIYITTGGLGIWMLATKHPSTPHIAPQTTANPRT